MAIRGERRTGMNALVLEKSVERRTILIVSPFLVWGGHLKNVPNQCQEHFVGRI